MRQDKKNRPLCEYNDGRFCRCIAKVIHRRSICPGHRDYHQKRFLCKKHSRLLYKNKLVGEELDRSTTGFIAKPQKVAISPLVSEVWGYDLVREQPAEAGGLSGGDDGD